MQQCSNKDHSIHDEWSLPLKNDSRSHGHLYLCNVIEFTNFSLNTCYTSYISSMWMPSLKFHEHNTFLRNILRPTSVTTMLLLDSHNTSTTRLCSGSVSRRLNKYEGEHDPHETSTGCRWVPLWVGVQTNRPEIWSLTTKLVDWVGTSPLIRKHILNFTDYRRKAKHMSTTFSKLQ